MRFFHELQEEMCGTATPVGCWQHQGNVRARPCILHYQTVSARAPNPDVHMVSQRCYQGHVGSLGSWLCMAERRAETAPWLGDSAPTGEGLSQCSELSRMAQGFTPLGIPGQRGPARSHPDGRYPCSTGLA